MQPFDHKLSLSHFHIFIQPLRLAELTEYFAFRCTLTAFLMVSDTITQQEAGHKA